MSAQEFCYKAVTADGRDFQTGTVDFARACGTDEVVRHSLTMDLSDAATFFSISTTPGDVIWHRDQPFRLFAIQPVGEMAYPTRPVYQRQSHNWRAVSALRVIEERSADEALGPNAAELLRFLEDVTGLSDEALERLAQRRLKLSLAGLTVSAQTRDVELATRLAGCYSSSFTVRTMILKRVMDRYPEPIADARKAIAVQATHACIDTGWGIKTRGLIPGDLTHALMRSWREVFGGDYA